MAEKSVNSEPQRWVALLNDVEFKAKSRASNDSNQKNVKEVKPAEKGDSKPVVLENVGNAPPQYPPCED